MKGHKIKLKTMCDDASSGLFMVYLSIYKVYSVVCGVVKLGVMFGVIYLHIFNIIEFYVFRYGRWYVDYIEME